jgi:hypothetical protein
MTLTDRTVTEMLTIWFFVQSENQKENQDQVCSFIESMTDNNYDEHGEINLGNLYFDKSKWANIHEYTKVMSPGQIFGLIFSISLLLVLLFYSCYLHSALLRKEPRDSSIPTLPRPKFPRVSAKQTGLASQAGLISRINSGITSARSHFGSSWDDNDSLTMASSEFESAK